MTETVYTIVVQGNDWYEDTKEWADEHYHVCDIPADSIEDAIEQLKAITPEQAVAWEDVSECNALDIVVLADRIENGEYKSFDLVAECEWIGDQLNGIWA